MTWFKVDDSFHSHPKVLATEPAALGLWVVAGSWCGNNLSDGFVPLHVLPRLLPDAATLAEALVTAGLWKRTRGGYQFHEWAEWQPTKERVLKERKAAAERQAKLRQTQKNGKSTHDASRRDSRVSNTDSHTTPTRPPLKGGGDARPASPGAARVPQPQQHSPSDHDQVDNPNWRRIKAFGTPPDPVDAQRTVNGAAAARAAIRKPSRFDAKPGVDDPLAELTRAVAELNPPPTPEAPDAEAA